MAQYPASGILFQNDRKEKPTQPDYTGNIELEPEVIRDLMAQLDEGVEQPKANLVGWRKTGKTGRPFLSLRGSIMRERQAEGTGYQSQAPANTAVAGLDDEIPF
tara:strand:+ start:1488 stop:1799 length:312 start_codon:yes stop_codon:yes gene_type:complete